MIFEARRIELWEREDKEDLQLIKESFHEADSWSEVIDKALALMARNIYKPYLESIELLSPGFLKKPKYIKVRMKV
jgi:hypothetical protein